MAGVQGLQKDVARLEQPFDQPPRASETIEQPCGSQFTTTGVGRREVGTPSSPTLGEFVGAFTDAVNVANRTAYIVCSTNPECYRVADFGGFTNVKHDCEADVLTIEVTLRWECGESEG